MVTWNCRKRALIYVAGYVAHRFRHKYLVGAYYRSSCQRWLVYLSRGNCLYLSKNLQLVVNVINEEFLKFHDKLFSTEYLIFDKLTSIIYTKISLSVTVIACLVRCRTYIHLRLINYFIKQKNSTRKEKKKLKHMCNKI